MSDLAASAPPSAIAHTVPNPRRVREERRATAHSRRVRRLRILLPTVSGLIAVGLVAAAVLPKLLPISALAGLSLTADGLVMNEPRLAGHLGEGRRYEVVAERAVQSLLNPSKLSLEGLSADLDMGEGERVTIEGTRAAYDTTTEILTLADGVSINSTSGNTLHLSGATVELRDGRVESTGDIEISSPKGDIRAGSLLVTEGGAFIRLTDGVSITIHPSL